MTPFTQPAGCGDWRIQANEQCDAGPANGQDGVGCRRDCTWPVCGDGHRASGELCDDGNQASGDGCSAECITEHTFAAVDDDPTAAYEILAPDAMTIFGDAMVTLSASEHFVLRASYDDAALIAAHQAPGGPLSADTQRAMLERLEEIWRVYIEEMGFAPPYASQAQRYKTNVVITDYGYLSGGTFNEPAWAPGPHPQVQMHFNATDGYGGMAHEFTHALQNMAIGADWFEFGGWFSESHAEFMTQRFLGDGIGCSEVLVNAPHQHYGTTRNRYCNWQFWDFLTERISIQAVNELWTGNIGGSTFSNPFDENIPAACSEMDGPFATLLRNLDWHIEQLNDFFGRWAMANVTWDYIQKGNLFRDIYGPYSGALPPGKRGRITRLKASEAGALHYVPPEELAPQRWGYNLVRLYPDVGAEAVTVRFRGVVQTVPARQRPFGNFNMEPSTIPQPDSGWRWGLVAIQNDGSPRYSPLQAGARATLKFSTAADDQGLYLMVMGAPTSLHQIFWDQSYYTIYRYPWRIQLDNAVPMGVEPIEAPVGVAGENHMNGGGFVADTATVAASAFVGPSAMILGRAEITGQARIEGRATVTGTARVRDQAVVKEHAWVGGHAQVSGTAQVFGSAQIEGGHIYGRAQVGGLTWVVDDTRIYDSARVISTNVERPLRGDARIYGTAQVLGDVELSTLNLNSGVWYGFVHEEFLGDPRWGADRVVPETEVTQSTANLTWSTDGADCRYRHRACADGDGCIMTEAGYECVPGATTPNTFERKHEQAVAACIENGG
ncbi:MAG: DUF6055 domain-containing protein [Myxococcota bacterium]|nr:DUF6055 domain-containing protein [Myxococcota bacterium]